MLLQPGDICHSSWFPRLLDQIVNARVKEMLNPQTLVGTVPAPKSSWEFFPNHAMPEPSPLLTGRYAITVERGAGQHHTAYGQFS
jgi:hypothetical protein